MANRSHHHPTLDFVFDPVLPWKSGAAIARAATSQTTLRSNTVSIVPAPQGLSFQRKFTSTSIPVESMFNWTRRHVSINGDDGVVVYSADVEAPDFWSDLAVKIAAKTWFRRINGEMETSIKGMITRVVDAIAEASRHPDVGGDYFGGDEAKRRAFRDELFYICAGQYALFNTPVWVNVGVVTPKHAGGVGPQASACMPADVRVNTNKGLIPIGELVLRMQRGETEFYTFDRDGVASKIQAAICNGKRSVLRFNLSDGSSLKMTSDHRVFVLSEDKLVEKAARDLVENDALVLTRTPLLGFVAPVLDLKIDTEDAWLAGMMVGNGFSGRPESATSDIWEIKLNTPSQLKRAEEALKRNNLVFNTTQFHWGWCLRGYGAAGRLYWKQLGIWNKTKAKEMPEWVFRCPQDLCSAFLRGLFDSDGSVIPASSGGRQVVQFTNTRPDIVYSVQTLCRSLGVFGSVAEYVDPRLDHSREPTYTFSIYDRVSVDIFAERIGLTHDTKLARLDSRQDGQAYREAVVRVVSREKAGAELVYDIQTACSSFWAEGILVHNCFIQAVADSMDSLCALQTSETQLFRRGSGTGSNLSMLRPKDTALSGGGTASGPVSFMRGLDGWAGVTKSGGSSRRAALMRILDVYHPDIFSFIETKTTAQKMIRDLGAQGWSTNFNATATTWIPYQNANQSVRVDDAFMLAATSEAGQINLHWPTYWHGGDKQISGQPVDASKLLDSIAQAAWDCGDPGMQFDTTINAWHTSPVSARINASNPCQPAFATVLTPEGIRTFADIDVGSLIWSGKQWTRVVRKVATGVKPVTLYATKRGFFVGTKDHRVVSNGVKTPVEDVQSIDTAPFPQDLVRFSADYSYEETSITDNPIQARHYLGDHPVYDITVEADEHTYWTGGLLVSNCSEYMYVDNSACNLASLRLTKYLQADGTFDIETFEHVCRTVFIAQEVLVGAASYPTELIAKNSHDFRPLGLGYADLGALLMQLGLAYDSDDGRAYAGAVTALMGGTAYLTSAEIARDCGGPFPRFAENRDAMLRVMRRHQSAIPDLVSHEASDRTNIWVAADMAWTSAYDIGEDHGFRNGQATVLAPTGTIGFAMDCDTTGVEPDTALVKVKNLAGGGRLEYVNRSIEPALRRLGYDEDSIEHITSTLKETGGLPVSKPDGRQRDFDLNPAHLPIFATAFGQPGNEVSIDGHLKMMAAVQPFLSGAISKTVNCPSHYTVADIREVFVKAWKLGLKAVAVYRDGCKDQPLEAKKAPETSPVAQPNVPSASAPKRRRLPSDRRAHCHKFTLGGVDGYVHLGFYENGDIGEIFVRMEPKASALVVDIATQAASIAIQHGADLSTFLDKWEGTVFAPSGFTGEGAAGVPYASSPLDYLAKWLRRWCAGEMATIAQETGQYDMTPPMPAASRETCPRCSSTMRRDGACLSCPTCGHGQGGCGG